VKTISLLLVLALHVAGIWPHISSVGKRHLISGSTDITSVTTTSALPAITSPILAPPVQTNPEDLQLGAESAIAIDRATATVLYAKNIGTHRPIASVTKIITALVVLSRHNPQEVVTVPTLPKYPVEAETMGLVPGDTFRLGDIIEAALIPSDNDAADTLAIIDAGSTTKFAAKMNAKMAEWGITDTHFASASGLEDTNNFASAASLAKIASLALHNPDFARIVNYQTATITSGQGRTYNLKTTNDLLASGQFYGIKTGYTQAAGECFVGLTRINGHDVITVVLGADNRFGATTTLTNWIGHTWQWL
jgi:serine-type D-Ala-D-Ala carboxypeptidase (penicillin-binding protein 5/6)